MPYPFRVETSTPTHYDKQHVPAALDEAGNQKVSLGTAIAGERLQDQASNSYLAIRNEANLAIISKTSAVTIGGGSASDTHLIGLHIHTALTGTCVINGFADSDGAAQAYTIPTGAVGHFPFYAALNSAGALTVTCSNASDDNLVAVFWRPAA